MAFDQFIADRIRRTLKNKMKSFQEKRMMGGLCFMVNDKMCFGLDTDKSNNTPRLMCRVGPINYEKALENNFASEMDFTGKPMKGYVFVSSEGFESEKDLDSWIQLCLDFNPLAKSSKRNK